MQWLFLVECLDSRSFSVLKHYILSTPFTCHPPLSWYAEVAPKQLQISPSRCYRKRGWFVWIWHLSQLMSPGLPLLLALVLMSTSSWGETSGSSAAKCSPMFASCSLTKSGCGLLLRLSSYARVTLRAALYIKSYTFAHCGQIVLFYPPQSTGLVSEMHQACLDVQ